MSPQPFFNNFRLIYLSLITRLGKDSVQNSSTALTINLVNRSFVAAGKLYAKRVINYESTPSIYHQIHLYSSKSIHNPISDFSLSVLVSKIIVTPKPSWRGTSYSRSLSTTACRLNSDTEESDSPRLLPSHYLTNTEAALHRIRNKKSTWRSKYRAKQLDRIKTAIAASILEKNRQTGNDEFEIKASKYRDIIKDKVTNNDIKVDKKRLLLDSIRNKKIAKAIEDEVTEKPGELNQEDVYRLKKKIDGYQKYVIDWKTKRALPGWLKHRLAVKEKIEFEKWNPKKKLSNEQMKQIQRLHQQHPDHFTVPNLAAEFGISQEAVRRILKANWKRSEKYIERRKKRFVEKLAGYKAELKKSKYQRRKELRAGKRDAKLRQLLWAPPPKTGM
ncbi:2978_t:CDS:2 [Paraglomus brasilianum]|uniref:Required for respiratory growth protein 9, mitochondrial n=1 Tax=Paraglomus brasilianum TaxID=144538 RepID=A0A9N9FJH9_9GLOM|nr:2978_t:CDS:2 [Paraglomus brasilianum]